MKVKTKSQFNLPKWEENKDIKVETNLGEPAKIVFTDGLGKYPVLAVVFNGDITYSPWYTADGVSMTGEVGLFFVEEKDTDMAELEVLIGNLIFRDFDPSNELHFNATKECANKVRELVRKEITDEQSAHGEKKQPKI